MTTETLDLITPTEDGLNNAVLVPAKRSKSAKKSKIAAKKAPRTTYYSVPVNQLGVIDQAVVAFERKNLLATLLGAWLGGIVPFGVYLTAHFSVMKTLQMFGSEVSGAWLWLLVVAGLAYSATTVYKWGMIAFSSKTKAFGFVVLLEGILTFSPEHGLSIAALVTLMGINAIATSTNLVANRRASRKASE